MFVFYGRNGVIIRKGNKGGKQKNRRDNMTEQQHELLNRYEEALRSALIKHVTEKGLLEGQLLEVEELNEKWHAAAPSYMADAVPEIAKYPLVAIAWAMYEGMGIAVL